MSRNIACIYQPHFQTGCYRVAKDKQEGKDKNYIIVTCSPAYNGIYVYDADKTPLFSTWKNRNRPCICVPIDECKKVGELEDIKKDSITKEVKKQQEWWLKNVIKTQKPEWMF